MKKIILFLTVGLLATVSLGQNTWYIDQQSGSDSYSGLSELSAFQTIDYAIDNFVQPGDTVLIIGLYTNSSYNSTYTFTGNINDPHIWTQENSIKINELHGLPGQYITFAPYDSSTVLKGDGANIFRVTNSSYLRIIGFEMEGEVNNIPLSTALALQFLYRENGSTNSLYRVPPGTSAQQVDTMSFPILSNISRPSYTDTRGLYLSDVHHIEIINNHIHHVPGNGLRVSKCDYINISGNEIDNVSRKSYSGTHGLVISKAKSFDTDTACKIFIYKNLVHQNYNEIYSWAPGKTFITPRIDEGKGISLQSNDSASGWTYGRFLVENNICYWNGFSGVHSNTGERMDFINNTCYMNSYTNTITYADTVQAGNNIGISTSSGKDIRIINNIIVIDASWGGFPISTDTVNTLEVRNNLVFSFTDTISHDMDIVPLQINTIVADPLFSDTLNSDFSILAGSPAIGAADTLFSPTDDYFGNTRDVFPDLGAIEYIAITYTDTEHEKTARVFPNPAGDYVHIQKDEDFYIDIFNAKGQHIMHGNESQGVTKVKLSNLEPGVYILRIVSGNFIETHKITHY